MSFIRYVAPIVLASPLLLASAAEAAPSRGATCDQIRGATEFASERWRIFRLRSSDDQSEVPRWACRRTSSPVRQLVSLPRTGQSPDDGYTYGGARASDVVSFSTGGRYGSRTIEIDLRRRATRTVHASDDVGQSREDVWLLSGAHLSYRTRLASAFELGETPGGPYRTLYSDVTLADSQGSRVLIPGSVFDPTNGRIERVAADPIDVGASDSGVVYSRRSSGAVERFQAVGRAADQGWASSPDVRLVQRRFPAPTQAQRRVTPLLGPGAQVYRRSDGSLSLQLTFAYGAPAVQTAAKLAPGSLRETRVIGENVVLGRFADDPGQLSVRVFSTGRTGAQLVSSVPAPSGEILSTPYSVGAVAWREGSKLVLQSGWAASAWRAEVDAPGARDLALSFDTLYYTDASGTPRALVKPQPTPRS